MKPSIQFESGQNLQNDHSSRQRSLEFARSRDEKFERASGIQPSRTIERIFRKKTKSCESLKLHNCSAGASGWDFNFEAGI